MYDLTLVVQTQAIVLFLR